MKYMAVCVFMLMHVCMWVCFQVNVLEHRFTELYWTNSDQLICSNTNCSGFDSNSSYDVLTAKYKSFFTIFHLYTNESQCKYFIRRIYF